MHLRSLGRPLKVLLANATFSAGALNKSRSAATSDGEISLSPKTYNKASVEYKTSPFTQITSARTQISLSVPH